MAEHDVTVPPLTGEDHVCEICDLSFADLAIDAAVRVVADMPSALRTAIAAVATSDLPVRPDDATWSVAEYVCHLRDAMMTATIRLHRATTEHRPVVAPMLNDLRAHRFGYAHADVAAVVEQIDATVDGFRTEVARVSVDQWDRQMVRSTEEVRTARWIVRQAAHEARHHVADIATVNHAVVAARRANTTHDVATSEVQRRPMSDPGKAAFQITDLTVHDRATFSEYTTLALPLVSRHGGSVVGVSYGRRVEAIEGDWTPALLVIHRWPNRAAFDAFYSDDDYIAVRRLRERSAESAIVVFETGP